MKDKRIMSYMGRVVWYNDGAFMVARGDGTDEYFGSLKDAMEWIKKLQKNKRRGEHESQRFS